MKKSQWERFENAGAGQGGKSALLNRWSSEASMR